MFYSFRETILGNEQRGGSKFKSYRKRVLEKLFYRKTRSFQKGPAMFASLPERVSEHGTIT